MTKTKILILCTGNSCRSQMAHAILEALNSEIEVFSAGTNPADAVHPMAIKVLKEIGLDISAFYPKSVEQYIQNSFDFVITVCDDAHETCPNFTGKVNQKLHIGFEDPAKAMGNELQILNVFRKVRDEILREFFTFHQKYIIPLGQTI